MNYFLEDNNIYIVFNDLDINLKAIDKLDLDKDTKLKIKEFITNNKIDDNAFRQKNYINSISTYIDTIKTYNLFVYIIPKEITLKNIRNNKKESIKKVQKLLIDIFKLYSRLIKLSDIKYTRLKEFSGNDFLELELIFYINQLNLIYNYLLNYKKSHKNIIICSDKIVGLEIDSLNYLELNPLKNYQFIKKSHQTDLVVFVYSLIEFLKEERLQIFKRYDKYKALQNIISKIINFLYKIGKVKKEVVTKVNLKEYFILYQNKSEIKQNKIIFELIKKLFLTQLENGVFFTQKIDLTKMFEILIQKRLSHYEDLYIGDESKRKIIGKNAIELNKNNFLLENEIKQYPDFMIKEDEIYHIIDAKYKLEKNLFKSRDIFWQVLIYAKLFNKTKDIKKVKKIIIYTNDTEIDLKKEFELKLDLSNIDIYSGKSIKENVFDSNIEMININIFKLNDN